MPVNNRKQSRREVSSSSYVDKLFAKYSKLNVIRVDLSYKIDYRGDVTLDGFNRDLNHLQTNQRSNLIFRDVVGFVIKLEQGDRHNNHLHAHAVFFVNGQNSKDDFGYRTAKNIGEYWSKSITKDKGSYHNCNINKYIKSGLGKIEYNDKEKIKNLKENVLPYLCKGEQSIEAPNGKNIRAFRRGIMPKQKNKGRPRKIHQYKEN